MRFSHLEMSSLKRSKNEWVIYLVAFHFGLESKCVILMNHHSPKRHTSRGKFYLSVYCLLELKCQVVRAEIGFKMCRFPSVGSVDLRLAPLITFACGCHRSEKAASSPDQKECKVATGWGIESPNAGSNHSLVGEPLLIRTVLFSHFFAKSKSIYMIDFEGILVHCLVHAKLTSPQQKQLQFSVQFFHDGNYCQLSCHFNCLLTGLFQNCSQHISSTTMAFLHTEAEPKGTFAETIFEKRCCFSCNEPLQMFKTWCFYLNE